VVLLLALILFHWWPSLLYSWCDNRWSSSESWNESRGI